MEEKQHGAATQVEPSRAPRLEVIRGENVGETFKVKLTTRIGRERDNDIVILDPKMSRYHAQISMEAGQWLLADLGSSNRTFLNGVAISEPTPVKEGDRISLGETELVLKMPDAPVTEPAPTRTAPMSGPIITPPPAPAAPAGASPAPGQVTVLPRLAWLAGGFIVLLFLVAAAILYFIFSRGNPGGEVVSATGTPAAVTDPGNESQPPAEAPNRPADVVLIYEDDFGDSASGWDDAFDAYTTKQYGNNRYQIEVTTSNLVAWGLANRDVADFEVEVEARLEDGADTNGYGLLFRFQDRENFYRFDISGDGYYLLSKFIKGEWITMADWTASPFINKGKAANILKVSAFGPHITVWANGQQLASVEDDSLTHGNFGFFAGTFSDPLVWVSFDNLKLWTPKDQEITLLPTATRPLGPPPTTTTLPTPTPLPATETSTATPATAETVEAEASVEPTVTPTEEPTVTPTSEPTATPVPLPEYASRDQTLARGEKEVTGRIIFPVFDAARGTYDIYIADAANGANKELVQKDASQPALSADGTDLAYRSWQPDKRGLFARRLSGGEEWQFNPFFESARPQFSPADKSLIFHSRVGGREPAVYRVINGVGEVMRREGFPVQGEAPKWSPDGQRFVYSSCLGGKCGVIRSNIDGANPVLLSDHPTDTNPEISPDGSTVVFMSKRSGNWEIYSVGIDGGNIKALTSDPSSDGLPTWSPDGQKIAFVANRDGEWSVWDMDPDGGNQRRLFALGGSVDGVIRQDPPNSRSWTEENIDWAP
ncbi:MAG: PD40 domain-containing protein [Anaerolineae bacterium]|nr:PD40 domain-containing protein [Anaerolineae bacterium]